MEDKLRKTFVVATYADLALAQKVVQNLLRGGFDRDDIRLYQKPKAADSDSPDTGEMMGKHRSLISVQTTANRVEPVIDIMNSQPPTLVEVGGEQWHQEEWAGMIPDIKTYEVLDLDFGDIRGEISNQD